jgi:hypothetical protein
MNLYVSLSVYSTDTFSEQNHLYLEKINGNISYEITLKYRKYRCDSVVSFFFYLS